MFGESIGDYVVSTLVLRKYLFGLVCPPNMMMFEVNVAGLGWDDCGGCELDCRSVVFKHDGGL